MDFHDFLSCVGHFLRVRVTHFRSDEEVGDLNSCVAKSSSFEHAYICCVQKNTILKVTIIINHVSQTNPCERLLNWMFEQ